MPYQWITTRANPRTPATGFDAGQTGWRLHAVQGEDNDSFEKLQNSPALCGVQPRHGWSLDLFISEPCIRCVQKALKLNIPLPADIKREYEVKQIYKRSTVRESSIL